MRSICLALRLTDSIKWFKHEQSKKCSYEILMKTKRNGNWRETKRNEMKTKDSQKNKHQYTISLFDAYLKCSLSLVFFLLSPLVIFLDSFSVIVIFSSFSSSKLLKSNISRWIFMIKWMASWKLCKNHKVNELKTFHDVYDDYILVKGTLLSLSFPFLSILNYFRTFHISIIPIQLKLNIKCLVLWIRFGPKNDKMMKL